MKRLLFTGIMAAAMFVASASKAEAVTTLTVVVCQGGLLCQTFGPQAGTVFTNNNIVVGDYTVSGTVSTNEDPLGSNAATVTTAIKRLTTNNAGALEIYLSAVDYLLPVGPNYDVTTVLNATSSLAPTNSVATYQGWFRDNNSGALPPSGTTPGLMTCNLTTDTNFCIPATAPLSTLATGSPTFSLITLTTFSVAQASTAATYTTNAQINITPVAVPEPASMMLLGSGLVGLAMAVRRRRRS